MQMTAVAHWHAVLQDGGSGSRRNFVCGVRQLPRNAVYAGGECGRAPRWASSSAKMLPPPLPSALPAPGAEQPRPSRHGLRELQAPTAG
jgi:hypothetical protein